MLRMISSNHNDRSNHFDHQEKRRYFYYEQRSNEFWSYRQLIICPYLSDNKIEISVAVDSVKVHSTRFIMRESTRTAQEPIRTYQEPPRNQSEPTRNHSELCNPCWFLEGFRWVLIGSWSVLGGFLKKKLEWFDWYWLYSLLFIKCETTRTHQKQIRVHQEPARIAWFWSIPGGSLVTSWWVLIGFWGVLVGSHFISYTHNTSHNLFKLT